MMKLTNVQNLGISLIGLLAKNTYTGTFEPNKYSCTTIIKSIQETLLLSKHSTDIRKDILANYYSTYGQAIHAHYEIEDIDVFKKSLLSTGISKKMVKTIVVNPSLKILKKLMKKKVKPYVIYQEIRRKKKIGKFFLDGQFDRIENGILRDLKVTSVYSYKDTSMHEKYIIQLSIYRWLFSDLVTENYGYIDFFFKEWAQSKAMNCRDGSYPASPVISLPLKLWSLKKTEKYILKRLALLDKYKSKKSSKYPECSPDERMQQQTVFKYFTKETNKRASKVSTSFQEVEEYAINHGYTGKMIEIPGEDLKCKRYCSVAPFCHQYKRNYPSTQ